MWKTLMFKSEKETRTLNKIKLLNPLQRISALSIVKFPLDKYSCANIYNLKYIF